MPLPDNNAPWPPPQLAPLYGEMRFDDAWYSGDRHRLAEVYQGQQRREDGRRRLWARHRQQQPGKRDGRLHIPLAGDIATASADLLFSEPPTFAVEDSATQDRLADLVETGGITNTLLEGAEVAAALGGVYLRITWDASLAARPLLTVVHADCGVPEFRFGQLAAVTFWHELASDSATVWRHLERHEPGRILHGLYQGSPDRLGTRLPLTEHPEVAALADSLGPEGDAIETGIAELTAAYVPNIRPNRRHRGSPFGRSDYAAPLHDLMDALDETWSSWLRDIRLARARLLVPDGYLRDHGPGRGASFDDDREIWQTLNIPPTEQGAGITLSQFAIRVAEHSSTADAIVQQAVRSAGYSAQTFGLGDQGGAVTATEVKSRERRSMITRDKKSRYWLPALADMLLVMLRLDREFFTPGLVPERPRVTFGDSVSEDPASTAQTLSLLQQAQAVSTDTKVRTLHPDWDDTAVQAEVDRILTETGQAVPDPMQAGALV
ncbi:phage portal protein [Streptomyces sp. ASQP_92]|uniref:phage portal protein n=1 Tax=Streptomyces sp. ASQP_92 TaxID=2979116 RepID=UPI0021C02084|nr:phage portal protein [Streptomyces sp. ASQP_92]MCT9090598.1 phage portal protein [Streptomyces sp. ASQP_92]